MLIVSAALLDSSGRVWSLKAPARHHDVIRHMADAGITSAEITDCEQGFVTSTGHFVNRFAAADIAKRAGQVKELMAPPHLYSEDVW